MQITRSNRDTTPGPSDWFTGAVYFDTIAAPSDASRLGALNVHFTPGARTAWHIHPHGQTIYVTEGAASAAADRSRSSVQVTSSSSSRARITGMAPSRTAS